mmetsp:Transcript_16366/g.35555  ORF Transcript_16366/g.35555 Transcript_16366/m.35555 type:complete len:236 (+) Transcript_16366:144-851(+)
MMSLRIYNNGVALILVWCTCISFTETAAFAPSPKPTIWSGKHQHHRRPAVSSGLHAMKRPILDRIATALFKLENDRVTSSSVADDKGRVGEPMEWSERNSAASRLSEVMAGPGYAFKQWVADIVAGEFDEESVNEKVDAFVSDNSVAMFSFTTCPFCRRAKDFLEEKGVPYVALELDNLEKNEGNEIRAVLGRKTRRTSVPAIFINGEFIGGCNDGPGLMTLAETGELDEKLSAL